MSDDASWKKKADDDGLGSLAQSARQTSLRQARIILIIVGILTLGVNLFMLSNIDNEIAQVKRENPGAIIDESLIRTVRLIYGATAALGGIFILLGIFVYAAPVACTVTGLVLYLGGIAVFAALEPQSLVRGLIIKILIIVGLVKSVQAAAAYQREVKAEREAARGYDRDSDY